MAKYDYENGEAMKMNKQTFYDSENDILSIHKGFSSDEKFKGNIDIGEIVLDVSTQGRIRGVEVMNAADFLKEFNINKEILRGIIDAQFNATIKPDGIIVGILIKSKNIQHEIPAKFAVPL